MTKETDRTDDGEDDTFLFIISYDEDSERKRVEYLFNNCESGEIETVEGLVRLASGVDHDDLYERIVNKVPADQVKSFRLEPVEADVERDRRTVEQTIQAPADTVESFLEYVFSKRKAVLQSAARNEYEVYTKKGRAELSYSLTEEAGKTTVTIELSGYSPAPEFLADFFETELSEYAKSQK
jgi:hypothetical protein